MNGFHKVTLIFLLTLFLPSCASQKKGPYKTTALTLLKSEKEIQSYRNNVSASVTTRNSKFTVNIVSNPDIYDYTVDKIEANHEEQDNENEKENISSFLSTYYFITEEKLHSLFPVENVSAGYTLLLNGMIPSRVIYIKKYDSEEDKENKSYHYFLYYFRDSYLYLTRYIYSSFNRININHIQVFIR